MTAPWCANETWSYGTLENGKRWARVSGRTRCPLELRSNVLWWFRNDYEQQLPDWFHPEWPLERREFNWAYLRNPLQNARLFVWGWADRNYTVTVDEGNPDPMVVQRDDVGERGYQKCTLTADNGETRSFTSYCGQSLIWYWGTQPSGIYGAKFVPFPKR